MNQIQNTSYRNTTLAERARFLAGERGQETAIFFGNGTTLSFADAYNDACAMAAALQQMGLNPGDTLSFQLPNTREAVVVAIAASLAGLIINPIVPIYRGKELGFILRDAQTRVLLIPSVLRSFDYVNMMASLRGQLPDLAHIVVTGQPQSLPQGFHDFDQVVANAQASALLPVAVDPDDEKIKLYTSGTTGNPKAVRHSHNTLEKALQNGVSGWSMTTDDLMLMPSPVTHITGYANGIELPFFSATKSLLMEAWVVTEAVQLIEQYGATLCVSATPFLRELVDTCKQQGKTLPGFRLFACGGASVPPKLIYDTRETLANCQAVRVYGSTETPLVTVGFPQPEDLALAAETDGKIHNYEVIVCDDEGNDLGIEAEGELMIRGPAMMLGYADAEQNKAAYDGNGFFHTGDIGKLLPSGAICITDRKKDIIIRGGENLSAREIEEAIELHPAVAEVAVVAAPHARLGEGVAAFIVPLKGSDVLTLEALTEHMASLDVAKQKWPQYVAQSDALPKTASGKVQKEILRKQLKEQGISL